MTYDATALAELLGIGRLVREERIQRRLSQPELARLSGTAQSTISRVEAGTLLPSWGTFVGLLAALDLQPQITAAASWSDVDSASRRLEQCTLEQLCADLEPWLRDICDATAEDAANRVLPGLFRGVAEPVPVAMCGASAAQLFHLPVRPRRIELMTSTCRSDVEQVLDWTRRQLMHPLDPRTFMSVSYPPEVEDVLRWGHLISEWGGQQCHVTFEPDFTSMPTNRLRVFDFDVPVLALEALCGTDPWVRRVLQHARGAA